MIYIGILDIGGFDDGDLDKSKLSSSVISRIENKKDEKSKKTSLASYMLLAHLYDEFSKDGFCQKEMPEILYTDAGKPYFKTGNDIKKPPNFSISHSKSIAVVAISDGERIGIDVQSTPPIKRTMERVRERFFAQLRHLDFAGRAINEKSETLEKPIGDIKYLFYKKETKTLELDIPKEYKPQKLSVIDADADFLAKWTRLEAVLKMSGGGFGDYTRADDLLDKAKTETVLFKAFGDVYAMTVAI